MKKELIMTLGVLLLALPLSYAQNCSETLEAGNDTVLCQPGASVLLAPSFNTLPLSVQWEPTTGLANASSLTTTATPAQTTTYTLRVESLSDGNLIFNGDFSQGDVGFSTDYSYGNGGPNGILHNEGRYAIATNPNDTHDDFAACGDHTGNGNMMVINSSPNPADVWCQTITVNPNTNYFFSAWITSVFPTNPARLQFSFNGLLLGDEFQASPNPCQWEQFVETWNSGSNTSVEICIANVNNVASGNDFAIDDLSFGEVCEYADSLTITVDSPPATPQVSCSSTTEEITFTWNSDPNTTGFQVTVVNGPNGQMISDTSYLIDGLDPEQEIEVEVTALSTGDCPPATTTLTCSTEPCPNLSVTLDGPDTVCLGETAQYTLSLATSSDGPFSVTVDGGGIPFTIEGLMPGEVPLSITPEASFVLSILSLVDNSAPNCTFTLPENLSVTVSAPANAGEGMATTSCSGSDMTVALQSLITGGQPGGQWEDISANPAGAAFDAATGTVNTGGLPAGTYTFRYTVVGPEGCGDSSAEAQVILLPPPTADAGMPEVLNCAVSEVALGGSGTSAGSSIVYAWEVIEGAALLEPNTATPTAQSAGVYAFTVTDQQSGCQARDTVEVEEQVTFPEIFATGIAGNCFGDNAGTITIDSVSGGQPPFQFSLDGVTFSPQPLFTGLPSGTYTAFVIDDNLCEGTTTLTLEEESAFTVGLSAKGQGQAESPTINLGDSILLELTTSLTDAEIAAIEWSPQPPGCQGCAQAFVSPQVTTPYTVAITDINGCTLSASITIMVDKNYRFYIPNAFSPNEDGRNDVFFVNTAPEFRQVNALHIMDRWGNMVFSQEGFPPNDPSFGWDGDFNGKRVASGVYTYIAELELVNGAIITEGGSVTVVY